MPCRKIYDNRRKYTLSNEVFIITEVELRKTLQENNIIINEAIKSLSETISYKGFDKTFEILCTKMIERYCQLDNRVFSGDISQILNGFLTGKLEETSEIVKINNQAVSRTSVENGYSGANLRKIITEAIKKGLIN